MTAATIDPVETIARVATALAPVLRELADKREGAARRDLVAAAAAIEKAVVHLQSK